MEVLIGKSAWSNGKYEKLGLKMKGKFAFSYQPPYTHNHIH